MRKLIRVLVTLFFTLGIQRLPAEPVISGYLDSSVFMGAGDPDGFSYGLEEYANIRLQAKVRDMATFYGSFNLTAVTGTYAQAGAAIPAGGLSTSALAAGENYAAAMELERLYFKVSGEKLDFQGGLMRLAYGYGLAFGPMDFLNPRNPLKPDARPRAVLGADLAFFPMDNMKLQIFTAAARDPFTASGQGTLAGISGERHGDLLSIQGLYAFEAPREEIPQGLHRAGLSLKTDLEVGLAADMLYTYDPHDLSDGTAAAEDGLAVSLGVDYSFLTGDLYVLAEYLYSGNSSSTALANGFIRNNYLYAQSLYRFDDYTHFSLACMAGLDDVSFTPVLSFEREIFQGFTLTLTAQFPPEAEEGGRFNFTAKARLRF
jgi:hypothetical protein